MGLSDRDYMRDRARENFNRERAFRPPSAGIGLPWIILFWVFAAFVLFKLYSTYAPATRQVTTKPARTQQQTIESTTPFPHPVDVRVPVSKEPPARPLSSEAQTIHQAPSTTNTIYLCRAYNGGTFWAQAHCNQHNALIERIAYVPPSLPFDQQVAIASQQQRDGAALVSSNTVTHSSSQGQSSPQHECKALEARITSLDAMARQPQSAQTQDWIAGKRKEARDRQFRLRC